MGKCIQCLCNSIEKQIDQFVKLKLNKKRAWNIDGEENGVMLL